MHGMTRILVFFFALPALAPPIPAFGAAAAENGKAKPPELGGYARTGWLIHAGYFFHDTMFYSSARGGPHAAIARVFPLIKQAGIWTEAGCMFSSGVMDTVAADSETYRTRFETGAVYVAAGPSLAYWPVPFGLALYFHRTELEDLSKTGPLAGTRLAGSESGVGLGLVVNILVALGSPSPGKGLHVRATLGYAGFIDSTRPDVVTASEAGLTATHHKWKAFRGECLRGGVELDF